MGPTGLMVTKRQRSIIVLAVLIVLFFLYAIPHQYQLRNTFSYITRPIWDTAFVPDQVLRHVWADGVEVSDNICELHDWKRRDSVPQVFDGVLFSTELDLLELRWNELDPVVDKFFLVESNYTFTGLPKSSVFLEHKDEARFARFSHKLVHHIMPPPTPGTEPFTYENAHRDAMTQIINENGGRSSDHTTLVIMADVDELPSAQTIHLLKGCEGWGDRIHLSLRSFLYSFEWELVTPSWRAALQKWGPGQYYGHSPRKGQEVSALADSGWHCSFCFRTIHEFSLKMTGYSHADRVGGDDGLLDPKWIQNTICKGGDIFNMLPEAYSYKDMYALTHLEPLKGVTGLPRYLVDNWRRFNYLLPGGCKREQ